MCGRPERFLKNPAGQWQDRRRPSRRLSTRDSFDLVGTQLAHWLARFTLKLASMRLELADAESAYRSSQRWEKRSFDYASAARFEMQHLEPQPNKLEKPACRAK